MILSYMILMLGFFGLVSGDLSPPESAGDPSPVQASIAPDTDPPTTSLLPLKIAPVLPDPNITPREFAVAFSLDYDITTITTTFLNSSQLEAYEAVFENGGYYSAFAISKGGDFGYSLQANSIEQARAIALFECQEHAPRCRVYAETFPVDYQQPLPGVYTLSDAATGYYLTLSERPEFAAMALSPDGAYSMGWDRPDQASIDAFVLQDCDESRVSDVEGYASPVCVLVHPPLP